MAARGRMITTDISESEKFASLSPNSMVLFGMLIPHWSPHGKMRGDLYWIKSEVCPLIDWLNLETIECCLREITLKTNVKWFQWRRRHYLHALNFFENNPRLRSVHRGRDDLPSYLDCQHLPANAWSSSNPQLLSSDESCGEVAEPPHKPAETPSTSTSRSTSNAVVPRKESTTTNAPARQVVEVQQEEFPLTRAALEELEPDDEAVAALVRSCRAWAPEASDAEIAHACRRVLRRRILTRNPIGFVLAAVPKHFKGNGYDNLRRSLAASQREADTPVCHDPDKPDGEYLDVARRLAVAELNTYLTGGLDARCIAGSLKYLEAHHQDPESAALCAQVRARLSPQLSAARGP